MPAGDPGLGPEGKIFGIPDRQTNQKRFTNEPPKKPDMNRWNKPPTSRTGCRFWPFRRKA